MCAKGPRKAYGEAERPPIDKHRKAERKERRRRRRRHESSGRSARILGERGDAACVISVAGRRSDVRRSRFQRDARAHACVPTHRRAHGAARPSCLVKKKKKNTHTPPNPRRTFPRSDGGGRDAARPVRAVVAKNPRRDSPILPCAIEREVRLPRYPGSP